MGAFDEYKHRINTIKPSPFTVNDTREVIRKKNAAFTKGLWISGLITFIMLALFILSHKYTLGFFVELRDVAVFISASLVVVAGYYTAQSLQLNIQANEKKITYDHEKFLLEQELKFEESIRKKESDKKLFAFDLTLKYVTSDMAIHMHTGRLFHIQDPLFKELQSIALTDKISLENWARTFNDHPARKSVIFVLNYFELIALAVNKQLADEDSIKEYLKTVIVNNYLCYLPYIKFRQSTESATFLEHLEEIAIKWSDGRFKKK